MPTLGDSALAITPIAKQRTEARCLSEVRAKPGLEDSSLLLPSTHPPHRLCRSPWLPSPAARFSFVPGEGIAPWLVRAAELACGVTMGEDAPKGLLD